MADFDTQAKPFVGKLGSPLALELLVIARPSTLVPSYSYVREASLRLRTYAITETTDFKYRATACSKSH